MAAITFVGDGDTLYNIPDDAKPTERGVEWIEDDVWHIVPWTSINEYTAPASQRGVKWT